MSAPDDDELEGCGIGFDADPVTDERLPWVVLFASVDDSHLGFLERAGHRHLVRQRADEWRELFGPGEAT